MLHGRTDILFLAENYAREGSLPVLSTSTYPISPNRQPGSAVAAAPGGGRGCDGGSRERSQSQIELIDYYCLKVAITYMAIGDDYYAIENDVVVLDGDSTIMLDSCNDVIDLYHHY